MWGAEDLVACLGGTSSRKPNGRYRDVARYARARVLLAAGARGKAAIDAVHLDIADDEAARDRGDGCRGIRLRRDRVHPPEPGRGHPRRVPARRRGGRVGARRAGRRRDASGGVFTYEGRMVDEPVLRHARAVLRRAES